MVNRRSPDAVNPAEPAQQSDSNSPRRAARARKASAAPTARAQLTAEARHALIADAAYLRAERRGFAAGKEIEDWLAAEAEVDALLKAERSPRQ